VQIKAARKSLYTPARFSVTRLFKIGDQCDLADGIYIGGEGAIVIKDGVFVMETREAFDKWGGKMDCDFILDRYFAEYLRSKEEGKE
jgi:hypothetical protein